MTTVDETGYETGDVNMRSDAELDERDVNTLAPSELLSDVDADARQGSGNGAMPEAVLEHIVRSMASDPDAVSIGRSERRGATVLTVHLAHEDMGRVIGRRGRTAQAIRTLVGVAGALEGVQTTVDIADD